MDVIIGIDLGTTNSEVAVVRDGRIEVIGEDGDPILPSVVGLDPQGKLLVGKAARNQLLLAPERTAKSIKRKMGEETTVRLGDQEFTPQEISAIILRALKGRAEKALGREVAKAVITVPAFFNDAQRQATRQAGELAGLEVVRILNEPTAAILTYDAHPPDQERILVYDLGGGTFDVSIARVEGGVVEILASHGDTQLGGDDFDQLLLDHVAARFLQQHGVDLRLDPVSRSRLLRASEEAKKRLSQEVEAEIAEEFIAEKDGQPLNLVMTVTRDSYEHMIAPLLDKTLACLDRALADAKLQAHQIHKVLLVGGATRTPMIHRLLSDRLERPVTAEIEPDLAVAMGAAVQGALIAGSDVGPVLVDITPHTLGIETFGEVMGRPSDFDFSPIILRNTPLPAVQTEIYSTVMDSQAEAAIRVFQGEHDDTRYNDAVGEFVIEGLAPVPAGNEIAVRLELDLNGILKVTATERATGVNKSITIDNAAERFRRQQRADALGRLEEVFRSAEGGEGLPELPAAEGAEPAAAAEAAAATADSPELAEALGKAEVLIAKADRLLASGKLGEENAKELSETLAVIRKATADRNREALDALLEDFAEALYYME